MRGRRFGPCRRAFGDEIVRVWGRRAVSPEEPPSRRPQTPLGPLTVADGPRDAPVERCGSRSGGTPRPLTVTDITMCTPSWATPIRMGDDFGRMSRRVRQGVCEHLDDARPAGHHGGQVPPQVDAQPRTWRVPLANVASRLVNEGSHPGQSGSGSAPVPRPHLRDLAVFVGRSSCPALPQPFGLTPILMGVRCAALLATKCRGVQPRRTWRE